MSQHDSPSGIPSKHDQAEVEHRIARQTFTPPARIFCTCGDEVPHEEWNEHVGYDPTVKREADQRNSRFD